MTKINSNPLVQGASGKFGETHVYRKVRGQMQMISLPSKPKKLSVPQQVMPAKLKRGSTYWSYVKRNPELELEYEKRITQDKFSAYHVALADSMNPPVVHYIKTQAYTGAIGDIIIIKATDDFKVTRVVVTIENADGKTIESGDASRLYRNKPQIFKYEATVINKALKGTVIRVVAYDHPGNKGVGEVVIDS